MDSVVVHKKLLLANSAEEHREEILATVVPLKRKGLKSNSNKYKKPKQKTNKLEKQGNLIIQPEMPEVNHAKTIYVNL